MLEASQPPGRPTNYPKGAKLMRLLTFISLAFTGALAVSLYLAIGEQTTALFLPVCFFYATTALFAQALALIARKATR